MNLKEIREIINLMNDYELTEFNMERDGFKISLKKGQAGAIVQHPPLVEKVAELMEQVSVEKVKREEEPKGAEIVSPMVGTFYAAPSPESPPYVKAGQMVGSEDVVCIIEAMKVMNEIKAETSGTIVEILATNGQAVEFGQVLFRVRPQ